MRSSIAVHSNICVQVKILQSLDGGSTGGGVSSFEAWKSWAVVEAKEEAG